MPLARSSLRLSAPFVSAFALVSLVSLAACGGATTGGSSPSTLDSGTTPSAPSTTPSQSACAPTSTSTLPGVEVHFDKGVRCSFTLAEAAQGVSFPYVVEVSEATTGVVDSAPGNACFTPDTRYGFHLGGHIGDNDNRYCICDVGLCQARQNPPVTLVPGSYASAYPDDVASKPWKGVSWSGPSDSNAPFGPAFPAGTYEVVLEASGTRQTPAGTEPFTVTARLPITLTP